MFNLKSKVIFILSAIFAFIIAIFVAIVVGTSYPTRDEEVIHLDPLHETAIQLEEYVLDTTVTGEEIHPDYLYGTITEHALVYFIHYPEVVMTGDGEVDLQTFKNWIHHSIDRLLLRVDSEGMAITYWIIGSVEIYGTEGKVHPYTRRIIVFFDDDDVAAYRSKEIDWDTMFQKSLIQSAAFAGTFITDEKYLEWQGIGQ